MYIRKLRALLSSLTLVFFIMSQGVFLPEGFAQYAMLPGLSSEQPVSFSLKIPQSLGKITAKNTGHGPAIIHIQEAHGSFEAQKNIEGILESLKTDLGVQTVLLEGSAVELNRHLINFFPNDPARTQELLYDLGREGIASGPEFFMVKHPDVRVLGIESLESYLENGEAFRRVLLERERSQEFLSSFQIQLERLTSPYINKELRHFLDKEQKFQNEVLTTKEWLGALYDLAKNELGLDLENAYYQMDWPMLVRLFKIQKFENHLDRAAFESERRKFLEAVKRFMVPDARLVEILSRQLGEMDLGSPETSHLFEKLIRDLPQNFNFTLFPNVNRFIGALILQSELEGAALASEMEALARLITASLVENEIEEGIVREIRHYQLLAKLLSLKLTPEEYEEVKSKISSLEPDQIISQLQVLNAELRVRNNSFENLSDIRGLIQDALEFYRGAKKRDLDMIENVKNILEGLGNQPVAVVTGGFHSGPFREAFSELGYHYASVIPNISFIDSRDQYESLILQFYGNSRRAHESTYRNAPYVSLRSDQARAHGVTRIEALYREKVMPILERYRSEAREEAGQAEDVIAEKIKLLDAELKQIPWEMPISLSARLDFETKEKRKSYRLSENQIREAFERAGFAAREQAPDIFTREEGRNRLYENNYLKGLDFQYSKEAVENFLRERAVLWETDYSMESFVLTLNEKESSALTPFLKRLNETEAAKSGKILTNLHEAGFPLGFHITWKGATQVQELGSEKIIQSLADMKPVEVRLQGVFISPMDGKISVYAHDRGELGRPFLHMSLATVIAPLTEAETEEIKGLVREFESHEFVAANLQNIYRVRHTNDFLRAAQILDIFSLTRSETRNDADENLREILALVDPLEIREGVPEAADKLGKIIDAYEVLDLIADDEALLERFVDVLASANEKIFRNKTNTDVYRGVNFRKVFTNPHYKLFILAGDESRGQELVQGFAIFKLGETSYHLEKIGTIRKSADDGLVGRGTFMMDVVFDYLKTKKGAMDISFDALADAVPFHNKYLNRRGLEFDVFDETDQGDLSYLVSLNNFSRSELRDKTEAIIEFNDSKKLISDLKADLEQQGYKYSIFADDYERYKSVYEAYFDILNLANREGESSGEVRRWLMQAKSLQLSYQNISLLIFRLIDLLTDMEQLQLGTGRFQEDLEFQDEFLTEINAFEANFEAVLSTIYEINGNTQVRDLQAELRQMIESVQGAMRSEARSEETVAWYVPERARLGRVEELIMKGLIPAAYQGSFRDFMTLELEPAGDFWESKAPLLLHSLDGEEFKFFLHVYPNGRASIESSVGYTDMTFDKTIAKSARAHFGQGPGIEVMPLYQRRGFGRILNVLGLYASYVEGHEAFYIEEAENERSQNMLDSLQYELSHIQHPGGSLDYKFDFKTQALPQLPEVKINMQRSESRDEDKVRFEDLARVIGRGFRLYADAFFSITNHAKARFENKDWQGVLEDGSDRISLREKFLDEVEEIVERELGERYRDPQTWDRLRAFYQPQGYDKDLSMTFFYSVRRRALGEVGIPVEYRDDGVILDEVKNSGAIVRTYTKDKETSQIFRQIVRRTNFNVPKSKVTLPNRIVSSLARFVNTIARFFFGYLVYIIDNPLNPFENVNRDIEEASQMLESKLSMYAGVSDYDEIEVLRPTFFRNKAAYRIGRVVQDGSFIPFAIPFLNSEEDEGITLDTVLVGEQEVGRIFSYTRADFHVDFHDTYREIAKFLNDLLPQKNLADIYAGIGLTHPAKVQLIKIIRKHIEESGEQFEVPPGQSGMVMEVISLPTLPYVFKFIKDNVTKPGYEGREHVIERYRLVNRIDRVGRMIDAYRFNNLVFEHNLFPEDVLQKLLKDSPTSVRVEGDKVIFKHVYIQRKVTPLDVYLRNEGLSKKKREAAVLDFGQAIKDLLAGGIYVGDLLLKNFGVTRGGKVVSYDFDEWEPNLLKLNIREIPEPPSPEYEFASPSEYTSIAKNDFFPEEIEWAAHMGEFQNIFTQHHGDLFTVEYWRSIQEKIRQGLIPDVFHYPQSDRFRIRRQTLESLDENKVRSEVRADQSTDKPDGRLVRVLQTMIPAAPSKRVLTAAIFSTIYFLIDLPVNLLIKWPGAAVITGFGAYTGNPILTVAALSLSALWVNFIGGIVRLSLYTPIKMSLYAFYAANLSFNFIVYYTSVFIYEFLRLSYGLLQKIVFNKLPEWNVESPKKRAPILASPGIFKLTAAGARFALIPHGPGNLSPLIFAFPELDLFHIKEVYDISKIVEESVENYTTATREIKDVVKRNSVKIAYAIHKRQQELDKDDFNYRRFKIRGTETVENKWGSILPQFLQSFLNSIFSLIRYTTMSLVNIRHIKPVRGYTENNIIELIRRTDVDQRQGTLNKLRFQWVTKFWHPLLELVSGAKLPGVKSGSRPLLIIGTGERLDDIKEFVNEQSGLNLTERRRIHKFQIDDYVEALKGLDDENDQDYLFLSQFINRVDGRKTDIHLIRQQLGSLSSAALENSTKEQIAEFIQDTKTRLVKVLKARNPSTRRLDQMMETLFEENHIPQTGLENMKALWALIANDEKESIRIRHMAAHILATFFRRTFKREAMVDYRHFDLSHLPEDNVVIDDVLNELNLKPANINFVTIVGESVETTLTLTEGGTFGEATVNLATSGLLVRTRSEVRNDDESESYEDPYLSLQNRRIRQIELRTANDLTDEKSFILILGLFIGSFVAGTLHWFGAQHGWVMPNVEFVEQMFGFALSFSLILIYFSARDTLMKRTMANRNVDAIMQTNMKGRVYAALRSVRPDDSDKVIPSLQDIRYFIRTLLEIKRHDEEWFLKEDYYSKKAIHKYLLWRKDIQAEYGPEILQEIQNVSALLEDYYEDVPEVSIDFQLLVDLEAHFRNVPGILEFQISRSRRPLFLLRNQLRTRSEIRVPDDDFAVNPAIFGIDRMVFNLNNYPRVNDQYFNDHLKQSELFAKRAVQALIKSEKENIEKLKQIRILILGAGSGTDTVAALNELVNNTDVENLTLDLMEINGSALRDAQINVARFLDQYDTPYKVFDFGLIDEAFAFFDLGKKGSIRLVAVEKGLEFQQLDRILGPQFSEYDYVFFNAPTAIYFNDMPGTNLNFRMQGEDFERLVNGAGQRLSQEGVMVVSNPYESYRTLNAAGMKVKVKANEDPDAFGLNQRTLFELTHPVERSEMRVQDLDEIRQRLGIRGLSDQEQSWGEAELKDAISRLTIMHHFFVTYQSNLEHFATNFFNALYYFIKRDIKVSGLSILKLLIPMIDHRFIVRLGDDPEKARPHISVADQYIGYTAGLAATFGLFALFISSWFLIPTVVFSLNSVWTGLDWLIKRKDNPNRVMNELITTYKLGLLQGLATKKQPVNKRNYLYDMPFGLAAIRLIDVKEDYSHLLVDGELPRDARVNLERDFITRAIDFASNFDPIEEIEGRSETREAQERSALKFYESTPLLHTYTPQSLEETLAWLKERREQLGNRSLGYLVQALIVAGKLPANVSADSWLRSAGAYDFYLSSQRLQSYQPVDLESTLNWLREHQSELGQNSLAYLVQALAVAGNLPRGQNSQTWNRAAGALDFYMKNEILQTYKTAPMSETLDWLYQIRESLGEKSLAYLLQALRFAGRLPEDANFQRWQFHAGAYDKAMSDRRDIEREIHRIWTERNPHMANRPPITRMRSQFNPNVLIQAKTGKPISRSYRDMILGHAFRIYGEDLINAFERLEGQGQLTGDYQKDFSNLRSEIREVSRKVKLGFQMHVQPATLIMSNDRGKSYTEFLSTIPNILSLTYKFNSEEEKKLSMENLITDAVLLSTGKEIEIFVRSERLSEEILELIADHLVYVFENYKETNRDTVVAGVDEELLRRTKEVMRQLRERGFDPLQEFLNSASERSEVRQDENIVYRSEHRIVEDESEGEESGEHVLNTALRRNTLFIILNNVDEPMTQGELRSRLQSVPGFAGVNEKLINSDLQRDERLKRHPNLKRRELQKTDQALIESRRDMLFEILENAQERGEQLNRRGLHQALIKINEFKNVPFATVKNDTNLDDRLKAHPAYLTGRTNQSDINARRKKLLEILNEQKEPITRLKLTQILNRFEGYEEVDPFTVKNDLSSDSKLGNHPNFKMIRFYPSNTNERRQKVIEILERREEPVTLNELAALLNQWEPFKDVGVRTVTSDAALDERIKGHPMLTINRRNFSAVQARRERLLQILNELDRNVTPQELWQELIEDPDYKNVLDWVVRNDIVFEESLKTHPRLTRTALPAVRKRIFGENIEIFLQMHETRGNIDERERAASELAADPYFKRKIKTGDFSIQLIRHAASRNLYLGSQSMSVFIKHLKDALAPEYQRYVKRPFVSFKDFIDIQAAIAHPLMQQFLDSDEFSALPKENRLVSIFEQIKSYHLDLDIINLKQLYDALPARLSTRITKKDIAATYMPLEGFYQLREALQVAEVQRYLDSASFALLAPQDRLAELVHFIKDLGLPLKSENLLQIYTSLPNRLSANVRKKDIRMVALPMRTFQELREALADSRVFDYIEGEEFYRLDPEDRLVALIKKIQSFGMLPDYGGLRQVHDALPATLGSSIPKREILSVQIKLEAYERIRRKLETEEVQSYLNSKKFRNLAREEKLEALMAFMDEDELTPPRFRTALPRDVRKLIQRYSEYEVSKYALGLQTEVQWGKDPYGNSVPEGAMGHAMPMPDALLDLEAIHAIIEKYVDSLNQRGQEAALLLLSRIDDLSSVEDEEERTNFLKETADAAEISYSAILTILSGLQDELTSFRSEVRPRESSPGAAAFNYYDTVRRERKNIVDIHAKWPEAVAVFGSARLTEEHRLYKKGVQLGQAVYDFGFVPRTGAGPAIMEAILRGYAERRDEEGVQRSPENETQGIRIVLPFEQKTSPYVESLFMFEDFLTRKLALHENTLGVISLPGGVGTLNELFEVWQRGRPFVLMDEAFWDPLLRTFMNSWRNEGILDQVVLHHRSPRVTDDPKEAVMSLLEQEVMANEQWQPHRHLLANKELEGLLRTLYKFPTAVNFVSGANHATPTLEKGVELALSLMRRGADVRILNRGPFLKHLVEAAKTEGLLERLQAVLYYPESANVGEYRNEISKRIIVRDEVNYEFLTEKNSNAFVFLPGGIGTMNKLFDIMQIIQIAKSARDAEKPIVLLGERFWQPIKDQIHDSLLSSEYEFIKPKDMDILNVVSEISEAHEVLIPAIESDQGSRSEVRLQDPIDTKETGESRRIAELENIRVQDLDKFLFSMGDFDKFGDKNKLIGKNIFGTPVAHSLFRIIREELKKAARGHIHRGVGGDETIPEYYDLDESPEQFFGRLVRGVHESIQEKYEIHRVATRTALNQEAVEKLTNLKGLLSFGVHGNGYNFIIEKDSPDVLGDIKSILRESQIIETLQLLDINVVTISYGAVRGDFVLEYLKQNSEIDDWVMNGKINPKRIKEFYIWGQRFANDMLTAAKDTGRNRFFLPETPRAFSQWVKVPAGWDKILQLRDDLAIPEDEVVRGRDRLASQGHDMDILTQAGFHDAVAQNPPLELIQFSVSSYLEGTEGRAFHNLQEALEGYDNGNKAINLLAKNVAASMSRLYGPDIVIGRIAPDGFYIAVDAQKGVDTTRGPPSTEEIEENLREFKKNFIREFIDLFPEFKELHHKINPQVTLYRVSSFEAERAGEMFRAVNHMQTAVNILEHMIGLEEEQLGRAVEVLLDSEPAGRVLEYHHDKERDLIQSFRDATDILIDESYKGLKLSRQVDAQGDNRSELRLTDVSKMLLDDRVFMDSTKNYRELVVSTEIKERFGSVVFGEVVHELTLHLAPDHREAGFEVLSPELRNFIQTNMPVFNALAESVKDKEAARHIFDDFKAQSFTSSGDFDLNPVLLVLLAAVPKLHYTVTLRTEDEAAFMDKLKSFFNSYGNRLGFKLNDVLGKNLTVKTVQTSREVRQAVDRLPDLGSVQRLVITDTKDVIDRFSAQAHLARVLIQGGPDAYNDRLTYRFQTTLLAAALIDELTENYLQQYDDRNLRGYASAEVLFNEMLALEAFLKSA